MPRLVGLVSLRLPPVEEVLETVVGEPPMDEVTTDFGLEEVIQSEAECLAAELQQAGESGVDPSLLEDLESLIL